MKNEHAFVNYARGIIWTATYREPAAICTDVNDLLTEVKKDSGLSRCASICTDVDRELIAVAIQKKEQFGTDRQKDMLGW